MYSLADDSDWLVSSAPLHSIDRLTQLKEPSGVVRTTKFRPAGHVELSHCETGDSFVISKCRLRLRGEKRGGGGGGGGGSASIIVNT